MVVIVSGSPGSCTEAVSKFLEEYFNFRVVLVENSDSWDKYIPRIVGNDRVIIVGFPKTAEEALHVVDGGLRPLEGRHGVHLLELRAPKETCLRWAVADHCTQDDIQRAQRRVEAHFEHVIPALNVVRQSLRVSTSKPVNADDYPGLTEEENLARIIRRSCCIVGLPTIDLDRQIPQFVSSISSSPAVA